MDEFNFGIVHVNSHKTQKIYLSNITEVTAKWKLHYVALSKKQSYGYMTRTAWEKENVDRVDDPEVFEFSITDVTFPV